MVAAAPPSIPSSLLRIRALIRLMALGLMVSALVAAVYGVRTAVAQSLYYSAKFGAVRDDVPAILERCERAHGLYAFNYYCALWAGEKAYDHARALPEAVAIDYFGAARTWCDRGVELNPYRRSLRLLKTHLLRRESIDDAIAYWDAYVDWNFWNPYHHALRAELYAVDGKWGEAMRALRWVKGSPYYDDARETVNHEWREQLTPPPGVAR